MSLQAVEYFQRPFFILIIMKKVILSVLILLSFKANAQRMLVLPDTPRFANQNKGIWVLRIADNLPYYSNGRRWVLADAGSISPATIHDSLEAYKARIVTSFNGKRGDVKGVDSIWFNGTKDTLKWRYNNVIFTAAVVTDTLNKFVRWIDKNTGGDSTIFYIGATRYAIPDRGGGGGSGGGISTLGTGFGLVKLNDSTYRADTTILKTIAAALNDYNILNAAKLNKSDSVAGGYYPYSSNPKGYINTAQASGIVHDSLDANSMIWQFGNNSGHSIIDIVGDTVKFRNILAANCLTADFIGDSVLRLRADTFCITSLARLYKVVDSLGVLIAAGGGGSGGIGSVADNIVSTANTSLSGGAGSCLRLRSAITAAGVGGAIFVASDINMHDSSATLLPGQTLFGSGATIYSTSVGTMAYAGMKVLVQTSARCVVKGVKFRGAGYSTFRPDWYYTPQNAIQFTDSASLVTNCEFYGFTGAGVLGMYYPGSFQNMDNNKIIGNYFKKNAVGINNFQGGNYQIAMGNTFDSNYINIIQNTANAKVIGNNFNYSHIAFYGEGGPADRGMANDNSFNHNDTSIILKNTSYGYEFNNNTFFYGVIYLVDCDKVGFNGGLMAPNGAITVSGSGITNKTVTFSNMSESLTNTWNEVGTGKIIKVGIRTDNSELYKFDTKLNANKNKIPISPDTKWKLAIDSVTGDIVRDSTGASSPISSLTPALKFNNINNGKYSQAWHWSGDTSKTGLTLQSNGIRSDGANGYNFIEIFSRGTNTQTSAENNALHVANNVTGGAGNTKNIAGKFTASGAAYNLAIYVPQDSGRVGLGTNTPAWPLHVIGTAAIGTLRTDDILLTGIGGSVNQFIVHNGSAPEWRVLGTSDLPTVPISKGGTGQITAGAAMNALLPTKTGNGGKFLRVNGAETDWEVATIAGGGDALTSGTLGQFASTTSAQLGTVLSDETGSAGGFVRATGPTITTPSINNITGSYTTTATAAGTTTLTSSSTYLNVFTGATTQTVVMPDATTLTAGLQYQVTNNSTGVVTVNKNGGTLLKALAASTSAIFTVTDISSAAGGWTIEYNSDLAIGSATGNNLTLTAETPTTPASNTSKIFTYNVGGRMMPGYIDPAGLDNALQPLFARNGIKKWLPSGNGTAIVADGAAALTATGTATAANVATTNRHTQIRGLEYLVTAAATTAVAGFREGANQHFFGNSAGNGGFFMVCRFGPATGVATTTSRLFVGMTTSTAAPTDVEPSSLTNMFGVGYDAADANIQFMQNDGSGTATKTSLGIAVPTADRTSVYELSMFCAPNSTTVYYTFKDLAEGGSSVSGNVSTDLPAVNTLFSARGYMSVGGTSSVIGIALKSLYIETDY